MKPPQWRRFILQEPSAVDDSVQIKEFHTQLHIKCITKTEERTDTLAWGTNIDLQIQYSINIWELNKTKYWNEGQINNHIVWWKNKQTVK